MLRENALKSPTGTYSLASVPRKRSLTNGTDAAANFSPGAIVGGEAAAAFDATFGAGASVAAGVGSAGVATDGAGAGLVPLLAVDVDFGAEVSSLVKYRKPPTPMAARQTSVAATGHIQ